jgi:hypothetical protein
MNSPILDWGTITEDWQFNPYQQRPTITFVPNADALKAIQANSGFINFSISGTGTPYDDDWWGVAIPRNGGVIFPTLPLDGPYTPMPTLQISPPTVYMIVIRGEFWGFPLSRRKGQVRVLSTPIHEVPSRFSSFLERVHFRTESPLFSQLDILNPLNGL